MTEHPEFNPDFAIPADLGPAYEDMQAAFLASCRRYIRAAMASGMSEASASTGPINGLVNMAAAIACIVRRTEILNGEPEYERWRAVTDRAFHKTVAALKAKRSEAAT